MIFKAQSIAKSPYCMFCSISAKWYHDMNWKWMKAVYTDINDGFTDTVGQFLHRFILYDRQFLKLFFNYHYDVSATVMLFRNRRLNDYK